MFGPFTVFWRFGPASLTLVQIRGRGRPLPWICHFIKRLLIAKINRKVIAGVPFSRLRSGSVRVVTFFYFVPNTEINSI